MDYYKKFQELLQIEVTDFPSNNSELAIYSTETADGYTLHVVTEDMRKPQWDTDFYYYEPSFDDLIDRIEAIVHDLGPITVYCDDIEEYFNEYEVEEFVNLKLEEDE